MSALSNARWLILIQGYKITLQLVAMGVLTRLLPPSDYGLMAMAWTAANFASLLKDLGTSSAIIQKKELTEQTKSTVFWLQMALSAVLCVALMGLSGAVSSGFKQPALQPILLLLALTFPLGSLSAVHQALLERQSKFQILARIEIVASTASLTVAVISALLGAGVYSFVWQSFTMTLLYVVQGWLASKWRPTLTWDREGIRQIFGYSGNLSIFNLINFMARNADSMIIGRFLGAAALGTYSMAYKLMLFPLQNLTFVASRALFPVMSRQQDSNTEIAALYARAAGMVAAIATPLMGGLFVLREPLSRVMFGGQWGDVTHVIAWLAPVGAMQAVVSTTGAIFMAKGRTDTLLKLGVFSAVIAVSAFFAGLSGGIVGVAMAYLVANVFIFLPNTYFASKLIDLPYTTFLRGLFAPVACTLGMCPLVYWAAQWAAPWGDLAVLIAASTVGAIAYFVYYLVFFRKVMLELLRVVLGSKFSSRFGGSQPDGPRHWLLVDIAPEFGGHEVMLLRWIDELKKSNTVLPVLVCLAGTRLADKARGLCTVIEVPGPTGGKPGQLKFLARLCIAMLRSRRTLKPELAVVSEGCLFAQRYGLYAARLAHIYTVLYVPLVSSFASMEVPQGNVLDRKVRGFYGKLPHAWLTITEEQAREFRAWSGVKQPIFTLPNTVQMAIEESYAKGLARLHAAPHVATQADRPADNRMHLLVLGRLEHHQKGLDLLLAHLQRHPTLADYFVVHFTGEGPYEATLRQAKSSDARLDRLIALEPWGNALDIFAKHDALLLPSRFEGVPLVMLEAMAFGLPIVASDLAGTRPYLHAACLAPVGQLDEMFARLTVMRQSPVRSLRMAQRNLLAFKDRASGAAFAAAVQDLTQRLRGASQAH